MSYNSTNVNPLNNNNRTYGFSLRCVQAFARNDKQNVVMIIEEYRSGVSHNLLKEGLRQSDL